MRPNPAWPTVGIVVLMAVGARAQPATPPLPDPLADSPSAVEPPAVVVPPNPIRVPGGAGEPTGSPPPLPDRVQIGKYPGYFQPGALLQAWVFSAHTEHEPTNTMFRLRRAEIKVRGEVAPGQISYYLGVDFAKTIPFGSTEVPVTGQRPIPTTPGTVTVQQPGTDRSPLQDFWITYTSDYADFSVGQFKIPVSLEALQSSSRLLFPERSLVTREDGDRRDLGIRIEKKLGTRFYYYAGLFNGSGANTPDNDRKKDLALRLEYYPIPGLTVGGVIYGTVGTDQFVRDFYEADLRYEGYGFTFQGEYIYDRTGPRNRRLNGQGAYTALAYMIANRLQPVARVGFLDTNLDRLPLSPTSPANQLGTLAHVEAGLNYFVDPRLAANHDAKLTLAAGTFQQQGDVDRTEVTFQSQVSF
jgi:hypothetical protein